MINWGHLMDVTTAGKRPDSTAPSPNGAWMDFMESSGAQTPTMITWPDHQTSDISEEAPLRSWIVRRPKGWGPCDLCHEQMLPGQSVIVTQWLRSMHGECYILNRMDLKQEALF